LRAAPPAEGEHLYRHFCETLAAQGIRIETGEFGADMKVSLVSDGPVIIWLDTTRNF
jgi:D-tyrosyl-tRNA(Tyr) deacylase